VKKKFFSYQQIFLVVTSLSFCFYLLGYDNFNFSNQSWLINGDLAQYQLGWKFYREDIWRFPLGLNPNYGISNSSSIIYSDSIPLFAIFFKIFRSFLFEEFQYFSFWIFICIYLQALFSFKIIFYFTKNISYSLVSSLFFIFSSILIYRSGIHLSLTAHWLILGYFYVQISALNNKDLKKHSIIYLSLFIHFYFSIILISVFFIEKIIKLKKFCIKDLLSLFVLIILSLTLMYVVGYFTIKIDDGLGFGYGIYNFNLNSFFNPIGENHAEKFNWSFFFPTLNFQNKEMEGFSYLGISGILFLLIYFIYLVNGKSKIIFSKKVNIIIFFVFLIMATSNNINFGDQDLVTLELNKYLYGILSSIRASGRLIWPVYYLIFVIGIVTIFQYFSGERKPLYIIGALVIFQLVDLAPGISNYSFGKQYENQNQERTYISSRIKGLSKQFNNLKLFKPDNNSSVFFLLNKHILNENYEKTDVSYLARINRQEIVNKEYEIIEQLNNKSLDMFNETLFVSDNYNFVRNVNYLFKDKLSYYKIDKLWLVANRKIYNLEEFNYNDKFQFYNIQSKNNNKQELNNFLGFGWERDNSNQIIMNGYKSSLLFDFNKKNCENKKKLILKFKKYFAQVRDPVVLKVSLNEIYYENITIINNLDYKVDISSICKKDNKLKIDLIAIDPKSLFDLRNGLNRKKRSIILNEIELTK
tara:strand:- start:1028 stop:3121 length:2094 start_codon:yes stop_codon:yes gene_type:complete